MPRDYIIRRMADIDENVNGEDYLGRTVYEEHELIDIGVLDAEGNKIMARQRMDQIGFVHNPEKFTMAKKPAPKPMKPGKKGKGGKGC